MQTAFERLATGDGINQPRRRLMLSNGSVLHYMAASDGKYFGAKVYSTHPRHGAHFVFLLYRAEDAEPLAQLEANYLGQIRTGAVSGLATRYMARADADSLGVIGTGFQARSQLAAMLAVKPIRHVKVWSRDPGNRDAFAAESSGKFSASIVPVERAEWAVREADIVVTATNARDPVIEAGWIAPGTHINAMGSNQARRRELPAELIQRAGWIAVDSVEQARMESGDLLLAMEEEGWKNPKIVELKDVVSGAAAHARSHEEVTIFKSNGLAIEDVICAGYVYEQGVKEGRGTRRDHS
jgi:ornithine cyclodeaminase/alanine dehydrogenase-like protein (mu-crystallin family)